MNGNTKPIAHGTRNGAAQHKRRGEKPPESCGCAQAQRDWRNAYYAAHHPPRPPRPRHRLALERARELVELGRFTGSAREIADRNGLSVKTIERYRALLREAA